MLLHSTDLPGRPDVMALARAARRFRARGPRRSLEVYLTGFEKADHLQARWVWLELLVEHHGEGAVEAILSRMAALDHNPHRWRQRAEGYAWALGRIGRGIVLPIKKRFAQAAKALRDFYCQALWYLGEQARGCASWLAIHNSVWSKAVLHNLTSEGWPVLLEWRSPHLWICDESLEALAQLAFSDSVEDRLYALSALDSWGPALDKREKLAIALVSDPDTEIGIAAAGKLENWGVEFTPEQWRCWLWSDTLYIAHSLAASMGMSIDEARLAQLPSQPWPEHRTHLSKWLELPPFRANPQVLLPLISDPEYPWRRLALRLYSYLSGDLTETLGFLRDPELRSLLVERLCKEQLPGPLLDYLEDDEVLSELLSPPGLFGLYEPNREVDFTALIDGLRQRQSLENSPMLARLLHSLSLEGFDWEHWLLHQSQLGFFLLRWHGRFPVNLHRDLLGGRSIHVRIWAFWLTLLPLEEALELLNSPSRLYPQGVVSMLASWGDSGWSVLWALTSPAWEDALALAMKSHPPRLSWLLKQSPQWFCRLRRADSRRRLIQLLFTPRLKFGPELRAWCEVLLVEAEEWATPTVFHLVNLASDSDRGKIVELLEQSLERAQVEVRPKIGEALQDLGRLP